MIVKMREGENLEQKKQFHAPPLVVDRLGGVVHDEPGPDVEVAVVDGLQDQPQEGEAQQDDPDANLRRFSQY